MNKIVFVILLIASLNSCISLPSKNLQTKIENPQKNGMLVGTISLENRKIIASHHSFFYKSDSIKTKDELKAIYSEIWNDGIKIKNSKGDFTEDKKWIYLFTIVKPEGKYNFYEIEVFLNSGTMQSTWVLPIDLPFEIEAGKTKYIGEINFNVKKGQLQLIDNIDRDRIKFKEKFPEIIF